MTRDEAIARLLRPKKTARPPGARRSGPLPLFPELTGVVVPVAADAGRGDRPLAAEPEDKL
jgi:hypothetical protein